MLLDSEKALVKIWFSIIEIILDTVKVNHKEVFIFNIFPFKLYIYFGLEYLHYIYPNIVHIIYLACVNTPHSRLLNIIPFLISFRTNCDSILCYLSFE